MRWGLCLVPSFPFIHGLALSEELAKSIGEANNYSTDLWDWRHLTGDVIAMALHFVVWNLVILILELDVWKTLKCCAISKIP